MSTPKKNFVVNMLENNTAEILLYTPIGMFEDCISSNDFVRELKGLETKNSKINLRINCPGGNVYEGIAIFKAIQNSNCVITGYIDGLAASMASLIALACDKLYMSKCARFMTHAPSGGAWGSAQELRTTADELDAIEAIANKIYMEKTGLTEVEVSAKFFNGKDNFFSANDALKAKLIDGIYDGDEVTLPANVTDTTSVWNGYNNKLQMKLRKGINSDNKTSTIFAGIEGVLPIYASDEAALQKELDRLTNVPGAMRKALDEIGNKTHYRDTLNINALHEWVNEETNYEDLSNELRKVLLTQDPGLYGALYWCEYGMYPDGMKPADIKATDARLSNIRGEQLMRLENLSVDELRKEGKLNRLKNLNLKCYNEKMGIADPDENDSSEKTALLKTGKHSGAHALVMKVSDTANFKGLSDSRKRELRNDDKALFNVLFYLQYGRFPGGIEMVEKREAEKRLEKIKKDELVSLMAMSFKDLNKSGKLTRLQHLSPADYNRKMQSDD